MTASYYSAGILLYTIVNGTKYFLLGRDCKYNVWSDFGGKCDPIDDGDPLKTASREFYEETIGVIGNELHIYANLKKHSCCIKCVSYKNNDYYMYLLEDYSCRWHDYIIDFTNQYNILSLSNFRDGKQFREKDEIRWFSLDEILSNPNLFRGVFISSVYKNIDIIRNA